VEAAAAAGKPVLCEKPMAATLADAEAMADAVRRAGIPYGTAYDQRHHPAHREIRGRLQEGRLGAVTAIRIVYACWVDACWSADNWRADPARAGGGALLDLAPHGLDLAQFLLDEPLVAVTALGQRRVHAYAVEDGAMVAARSASGALLSLHLAYNHPEGLPRRRLEVVGTEGMLVAENTMGQTPGGTLTWLDREGRAAPVPVPFGDPFAHQMAAFCKHVREGGGRSFDLERDIQTERLLHRAMEQCL
jgi:predicted dehydrogenase